MADKEQQSGLAMIKGMRMHPQADDATDLSKLNDTLVKSALWKRNTLQGIEDARIGGKNDDAADPEERRQAATLRRRADEIELLQQTITKLEDENATLTATHQEELGAHRNELLEFQHAYDQFQEQSDSLLNELDQENERLRDECKVNNNRSLL